MDIAWSEEFASGIPLIDSQHKSLIGRIHKLQEAVESGRGRIEARRAVAFIEEYARMHFSLEEEHMERLKYPERVFHKEQHREFMKTLEELKREAARSSFNEQSVRDIQYELWNYYRLHISVIDAAMARFFRERRADI